MHETGFRVVAGALRNGKPTAFDIAKVCISCSLAVIKGPSPLASTLLLRFVAFCTIGQFYPLPQDAVVRGGLSEEGANHGRWLRGLDEPTGHS